MKDVITIFQMLALLLEMVTAIGYQQKDIVIHNYQQKIYLLEVKMDKGAKVQGVLAQNSIFGFDTIGNMVKKNEAIAGVNGMFFDDLGSPAGLLCENGKWLRISDIGTPSLVIEEKPSIQEIKVKAFWQSHSQSGEIQALNIGAFYGLTNVFTSEYGQTNRVFRPQVTYSILEDKVVKRYISSEPIETEKGYLITYLLPDDIDVSKITWDSLPKTIPQFEINEVVKIRFQTKNAKGQCIQPQNVYQSGGWLIKQGQINAKPYEDFIGFTTSLQPRTAVGINREGNLIFLVADGRQKQVAEGLTGQWLAEVMAGYEITEAAYLDGGASSVLWMGKGLVNNPAYVNKTDGKEIAHTILLNRRKFNGR